MKKLTITLPEAERDIRAMQLLTLGLAARGYTCQIFAPIGKIEIEEPRVMPASCPIEKAISPTLLQDIQNRGGKVEFCD